MLAIHQPNFFPWLGYFYKIARADKFVILDNVDFQQGNHDSITNRAKVKLAGEEKIMTLPVKKNENSKLIRDIYVDSQKNIFTKHVKTLQSNYARAGHFKECFPMLESL